VALFEPKVPGPIILSRIEKRLDLTGFDVDGHNIASLETIAREAGPGKVGLASLAAVFACHDMVYLVGEQCVFLVD